jgi:hypothetical protein
MILWKRMLRTASSERFLAIRNGKEVAAVDLHFLDHATAGTVVLYEDAGIQDRDIPALLASLDDDLLPGVDLESGTLTFTVVRGKVLGNFEATDDEADAAAR